jgi:6-phosphogluconate dehydrogenase
MQMGMIGLGRMGANMVRRLLHYGPSGAGHSVKMVHNGIEYGLMAAYAEGLNVLRGASAGTRSAMRHAFGGHEEKKS